MDQTQRIDGENLFRVLARIRQVSREQTGDALMRPLTPDEIAFHKQSAVDDLRRRIPQLESHELSQRDRDRIIAGQYRASAAGAKTYDVDEEEARPVGCVFNAIERWLADYGVSHPGQTWSDILDYLDWRESGSSVGPPNNAPASIREVGTPASLVKAVSDAWPPLLDHAPDLKAMLKGETGECDSSAATNDSRFPPRMLAEALSCSVDSIGNYADRVGIKRAGHQGYTTGEALKIAEYAERHAQLKHTRDAAKQFIQKRK